jgi:hypothetical protein
MRTSPAARPRGQAVVPVEALRRLHAVPADTLVIGDGPRTTRRVRPRSVFASLAALLEADWISSA